MVNHRRWQLLHDDPFLSPFTTLYWIELDAVGSVLFDEQFRSAVSHLTDISVQQIEEELSSHWQRKGHPQ